MRDEVNYLIPSRLEDAPAPNALHTFKTHISDGKIYVTADPARTTKENKSRAPKLLASGSEGINKGTVIVGGGSASFYAVESLREVCPWIHSRTIH
jgi:hypothetical protein